MSKDRYVAYVGTYTHGTSIGIHLYDVDVEQGLMKERKVVPINNSLSSDQGTQQAVFVFHLR